MSVLSRKEHTLMPEGVNPVWGREGLLVPKHVTEATLFHPGDQNGDQAQV